MAIAVAELVVGELGMLARPQTDRQATRRSRVDAQLVGHDRGLRLLHVDFDRNLESLLPGWLVLVDASGHRFVDETAPYGVLDIVLRAHNDRAFAVFDHRSLERTTEWGLDQFAYSIPGHDRPLSKHWNPDLVEQMHAAGAICVAQTVSALAEKLSVDPTALTGTGRRSNATTRWPRME